MRSKQVMKNLANSRKHEEYVADRLRDVLGGVVKVQPGSGNQATAPGDVVASGRYFVECKATAAESISLKHAWLTRLKKLAQQGGLRSILAIRFVDEAQRDFFLVDEDTFLHLLSCEREVVEQ